MTVVATLRASLVTAQIVQFDFTAPIDDVLLEPRGHWLDLCLTPRLRNARACFPNHWHARRFEPLGDTYLVPQGTALHARGDSGSHSALICLLHSDPILRWFEDDLQWMDGRLTASLDIRNLNVRSLLLRLAQEARHPGFAHETLAELLAGQLLIELARHYQWAPAERTAGPMAPWRLRLIDDRLADQRPPPTLTELAKLCRLSIRQLTRSFRASRGCSIGDYITRHRLQRAQLLLSGEQSIKTISYSMGFASSAAFCYAFRRATGRSPGDYRRQIRRSSRRFPES
jgi:AraC family transcriptional regulator